MQESSILSPMILNVSMLSKAYVGKTVLKDVSFHLEDKEKAAIVGINGSGKTTLLRCILGIEEADEGSIAFSKEKKMDYLAQQHADIETENEDYDTLSGGQKTRKRLEEILQEKPDLLILDEPTNHLDIRYRLEILSIIKDLGITVLAALHDLGLAAQYCDYLYLMRQGEIVESGAPEEVMTPETLRRIFDVEAAVYPSPIDGKLMIQYL